jgi:hypothetical protein
VTYAIPLCDANRARGKIVNDWYSAPNMRKSFWYSVAASARQRTTLLSWTKGGISVAAVIVSFCFQWELGLRPLNATLLCILAGVLTYAVLAIVEFVTGFAKEASAVHEQQEEDNSQLRVELEAARNEFREALKADRPEFAGEVLKVQVEGDHEHPDWIKLFVLLTIRNTGAAGAVDRWKLEVVTPPHVRFIFTEEGLTESNEDFAGRSGGNLLHDENVIVKGGKKSGWLLYHGPKNRIGNLTTGQTAAVRVWFYDVNGAEYSAQYPRAFFQN